MSLVQRADIEAEAPVFLSVLSEYTFTMLASSIVDPLGVTLQAVRRFEKAGISSYHTSIWNIRLPDIVIHV